MADAKFLVGIDLGTSNCAAAFAEIREGGAGEIQDFGILQAERPGAAGKPFLLPSALYLPLPEERSGGALELPWPQEDYIAGQFARWRGSRVPGRLITSAKSWLSHAGVDRTAAILPWGAPGEVKKISPVSASARLLRHIRHAWDHEHPEAPLGGQEVVVTVPASFDESARALTVEAAREAGLEHFTLLEEPQAAFYHFTYRHASSLERRLEKVQLVLVVDAGGGTTDLTLVRVANTPDGPLLKRIAVGDHLILGGDNMDNAAARRIEEKLAAQKKKLSAAQWLQLVQAAREAKETLLGRKPPEQSHISLAGEGSQLFGSTVSSSITREELEVLVLDGFFPFTKPHDLPKRGSRSAIHEMGLPYEPEPGISRHIAGFLRKHAAAGFEALGQETLAGALPRPDAVLLNGGVFNSQKIANRLVEVLSSWWPERPEIPLLEHDTLDLAVSRGAAHYGRVRRGFGKRIGGGSAHAFFAGVGAKGEEEASTICLIPRGLEEGETVEVRDRVFKLQVGRPVRFPIYSTSADRVERPGEVVPRSEDMAPLPPIQTVLKSGRDRVERIPVYLRGRLTEIGTVELWCAAAEGKEQWRLEFQARGGGSGSEKIAATESLPANYAEAKGWIELIYGNKPKPRPGSPGPKDAKQLWTFLERSLGPRESWSAALLRQVWSDLFPHAGRRRRSAAHERIFLQLLGYSLRPGFGSPLDEWRAEQSFKLFDDRVEFHKEKPNWNEFWIFWRRIAGGLSPGQQEAVWDYLKPHLASRIPLSPPKNISKPKGPQPEGVDEMVRTAASLEHLAPAEKEWLGGQIASRVRAAGPAGGPWAWSLGRIGSRAPFYGSLHNVLSPEAVEPWIRLLLETGPGKLEGAPFALAQICRMTGDRVRDIDAGLREEAAAGLREAKASENWLRMIQQTAGLEREDEARVLGDTLPIGLQLSHGKLDF